MRNWWRQQRFDYRRNACNFSSMMEEPQKNPDSKQPEEAPQQAGAELEELSPEEQMAKFEEAMKNDDWGHQPC